MEVVVESIESSKFVSHKARISGEFDSKKDSHPAKVEQKPRILVKLGFRELCDSMLSGLHTFKGISLSQNRGIN